MKLYLDTSGYILNVYTKFQIDISKHVKKVRKIMMDGRTEGQKLPWHYTTVFQMDA